MSFPEMMWSLGVAVSGLAVPEPLSYPHCHSPVLHTVPTVPGLLSISRDAVKVFIPYLAI